MSSIKCLVIAMYAFVSFSAIHISVVMAILPCVCSNTLIYLAVSHSYTSKISFFIVFRDTSFHNWFRQDITSRSPWCSTIRKGFSCMTIVHAIFLLVTSRSKWVLTTAFLFSLVAFFAGGNYVASISLFTWHVFKWSCKCFVPSVLFATNALLQ